MKQGIKYLMFVLPLMVIFAGCEENSEESLNDGTLNVLSVNLEKEITKELDTVENLRSLTIPSTEDHIGVFLTGAGYEAKTNVDCGFKTSTGWTTSETIYLKKGDASVCAYYPYNAAIENSDLPLTAQLYSSSSDLYYCPNIVVNSKNTTTSSVSFSMLHAYAKITFSITRDVSYNATGNVTRVAFVNSNIVSQNTLNIATAAYGTPQPTATGSVRVNTNVTLPAYGGGASTVELLIPPTKAGMTGNVDFYFTIDGEIVSASLPVATNNLSTLSAGNNYSASVTINGKSAIVNSVRTTDWNNVSSGTTYTFKLADEANSYIVPLGHSVYIPVSRVATAWTQINGSTYTLPTTWTAGLLWTTNSNGLSASGSIAAIDYNREGGYIKVSAGSAEGNGVIAFYDGANILWSWHIWVTNYNPNTPSNGAVYTYNSRKWMDRNLGATTTTAAKVSTLGLLYQWGRKDPFSGSASVTTDIEDTLYNAAGLGSDAMITKTAVSDASNLTNSIQYPLTFYYGLSGNYDWYSTTTQNDALWGGANITIVTPAAKTIYDPCPSGWRVPVWSESKSPWYGFDAGSSGGYNSYTVFPWYSTDWATSYGRIYSSASNTYYPAASCRSSGTGALSNVGSTGYYWSASPNGSYGYSLTFISSFVYPSHPDNRANGFSVRCVQE